MSEKPQWEKMSKSRGNVITPDEVIYGVAELAKGFEFRYPNGEVVDDFKEAGVWRNRGGDSMFYTSTRTGKVPVFLHQKGNAVPAMLVIEGEERVQHAGLTRVWEGILRRNPEEKS